MNTKEQMVLAHETIWTDPDGTAHHKKHFVREPLLIKRDESAAEKALRAANDAVEAIRSKLGY